MLKDFVSSSKDFKLKYTDAEARNLSSFENATAVVNKTLTDGSEAVNSLLLQSKEGTTYIREHVSSLMESVNKVRPVHFHNLITVAQVTVNLPLYSVLFVKFFSEDLRSIG